ncbi:DUF1080 domain-containing protein [Pelobium sp.]|nr:DUF1080 domain-containing protein [Pelobium sp.]MDA9555458.1 DUF1080 domain-containing protein [Pelobium sp.]
MKQKIIKYFFLFTLLVGFLSCKTLKNTDKGFVSIFNGKSLKGWMGDTTYWKVINHSLVGEVTPATILKRNSFIIWKKGLTSDFELKVDYRISPLGNSGINYRSEELKDIPFALKGYQADIDGANRYTGQNYEERGRGFLALPGQSVVLKTNQKPIITGSTGDVSVLKANLKPDWNECHILAKGNKIQHYINGVLMSEIIDEDSLKAKKTGLLGVQVHVGPPMKVEYRNFRLKQMKLKD